jgi:hypothetical protein
MQEKEKKQKVRKAHVEISSGNLTDLVAPFLRQLKLVKNSEEVIHMMVWPLAKQGLYHIDYTVKEVKTTEELP